MHDRKSIDRELSALEQSQRELEILYEQYFAGIEKREPVKTRDDLAMRLRRFSNRRIMQTDLRFRYQSLATRFHSYSGHWDRILRQMDEGRYPRHLQRAAAAPARQHETSAAPGKLDEVETVYRQMLEISRQTNGGMSLPDRQQLATFMDRQKEKIREKFGDREVEFRVVAEDGKPKIKVRAKS